MKMCCFYGQQTDGKWHSLMCTMTPNVCGNGAPMEKHHYKIHDYHRCSMNSVLRGVKEFKVA